MQFNKLVTFLGVGTSISASLPQENRYYFVTLHYRGRADAGPYTNRTVIPF